MVIDHCLRSIRSLEWTALALGVMVIDHCLRSIRSNVLAALMIRFMVIDHCLRSMRKPRAAVVPPSARGLR